MPITVKQDADTQRPYTVTRAICLAGERVEVGETVMLTRVQGTELAHAGKVVAKADADADAAQEPAKAAKPKVKAE